MKPSKPAVLTIGIVISFTLLAACSTPPAQAAAPPVTMTEAAPTLTVEPTHTPSPVPPTATPTIEPTATILPLQVCSPLEGYNFDDLKAIASNPFNPPPPGMDDPHYGVDFSFYRYKDRIGMLGLPVQAAIPGTVAMVQADRFPYGIGVIIETPLDQIPQDWQLAHPLPTPGPLNIMDSRLFCPTPSPFYPEGTGRSLYILYAHLQNLPDLKVGDPVGCGQVIGAVGNTGNSYNEHLHFEVRVGPSSARFGSMAHYDNSADNEEMGRYCTWRVSGIFQVLDPMTIFD